MTTRYWALEATVANYSGEEKSTASYGCGKRTERAQVVHNLNDHGLVGERGNDPHLCLKWAPMPGVYSVKVKAKCATNSQ